jgi:23S rRNA (cytosine1962-C5)-methyltransferase
LLSAELFQKIVADAAVEAGRLVRVVKFLGQAGDHPVALNFPEGKYLKGLMCFVE